MCIAFLPFRLQPPVVPRHRFNTLPLSVAGFPSAEELPKAVGEYRKILQKYLAVYDTKLLRESEKLYDMLHIACYYRSLLSIQM